MTDLDAFVSRYIALWNEPDAANRRGAIAALFRDDATHRTRTLDCTGHAEIEARVRAAHDKFVGSGDYVFRTRGTPDAHHDGLRLDWEMVAPGGGESAAKGSCFFVLDDENRIRAEYQFA